MNDGPTTDSRMTAHAEIRADYADTSAFSHHVDSDFYTRLDADRAILSGDWDEADPALLARVSRFLIGEARLIDKGRFDDWLRLFSADGLYWVPVIRGGGDPREQISHAFDDVRRLTDRVFWLNTGLAHSQIPPSRLCHVLGNVEAIERAGVVYARSTFMLAEHRPRLDRHFAGSYGHVLVPEDGGFRIRLKQVNLIDSDRGHENLTLVF